MLSNKALIHWILIFVGIIFLVYIINIVTQMNTADYFYRGLPLKYVEGGGMCPPGPECTTGCPCPRNVYPINLAVDILIWLIIAFGIAYWIDNKKKDLN